MRSPLAERLVPVCATLIAVLTSCAAPPPIDALPATLPDTLPAAQPVAPDPRVGAVFLGGGDLHMCSGAVLASGHGDLILTAAHCLADGVDTRFVPRFEGGAAPDDGWHVDAVYLDPRWVLDQDPLADFAIARVRLDRDDSLEAAAGGGLRLGAAPAPGTDVTVTGYAAGVGGGPTSCRAPTVSARQGFPALHCDGLVAGFSGAPWITGSSVSGVIGGLDGGGCLDEVSYSPPFDGAIAALLERAEAGGPGDRAPSVFDDGCD